MSEKTIDCCSDGHDRTAMTLGDALARILATIRPIADSERLAVRDSLGRVVHEDVRSGINVPAHTNSAMDGYAFRGGDLSADGDTRLAVVGTAAAGRPYAGTVTAGQAVRILTGAPIPDGADTVAMQERTRREGDAVIIAHGQRPGEHVRKAGEDLRRGDVALRQGTRLMPAELGMLASLGVSEVSVRRRPRVAFFSTGDELRNVGEPLDAGQIYDSNRYTIFGMLERLGVEPIDLGIVPDERDAIEAAVRQAATLADAIVTSGGVSVGDADYVKEILERTGSVDFWQVAIKPGRPLAFGRIGNALFFGLPGNPVSVMATFYQLVQPALAALAGYASDGAPLLVRAVAETAFRKKPGRREFQRGRLTQDADGRLRVRGTGHQGSGVLSSMSVANCFIVLPEDSGPVAEGDEVLVQPFATFI